VREKAENEKHGIVRRKDAEKLHHREKNDVGDQRNAASVAIRQQPENHRAHGTHEQRPGNRGNDICFRDVKLRRQRIEEENDHEEIEGVQRPAEKSGGHSVELSSATSVLNGGHGNWPD